jgi:hypothetical protein
LADELHKTPAQTRMDEAIDLLSSRYAMDESWSEEKWPSMHVNAFTSQVALAMGSASVKFIEMLAPPDQVEWIRTAIATKIEGIISNWDDFLERKRTAGMFEDGSGI